MSRILVLSNHAHYVDFFLNRFPQQLQQCDQIETLISHLIRMKYASEEVLLIFIDESILGQGSHVDLLKRLHKLNPETYFIVLLQALEESQLLDYQIATDNQITLFQNQVTSFELKQSIHQTVMRSSNKNALRDAKNELLRIQSKQSFLSQLFDELFTIIRFDKGGIVQEINPYGSEITGWHLSQIVGRSIHEIVLLPIQSTEKKMTGLENFFGEARYYTSSGSQKWLLIQVRKLSYDGRDDYYIIGIDITDQKKKERMQQFDNYQEGIEKAKSELVHNFGNTLNSMVSTQDVMFKGVEQLKNLSGYMHRWLDEDKGHPLKVTQFMIMLEKGINQILAEHFDNTATILQNDLAVLIETINLNQNLLNMENSTDIVNLYNLVQDVIKSTQAMLNKAQIELRVLDSNRSIFLVISRNQLFQALLNLVKNAAEALITQQQKTRLITIQSTQTKNNEVWLTVNDNGEGIPDNQISQIFNYGYTTKKIGTGQGLHSVANFMNTCGGSVEVVSSPQKGTHFILKFPSTTFHKVS